MDRLPAEIRVFALDHRAHCRTVGCGNDILDGSESRLQCGQPLPGCVRPRKFVLAERERSFLIMDGDDAAVEPASAIACTARRWLSTPKASSSARAMPSFAAIASAATRHGSLAAHHRAKNCREHVQVRQAVYPLPIYRVPGDGLSFRYRRR